MKNIFAVSNIGWNRHDDPAILDLLSRYHVTGIEVAPSKVWSDLSAVTEKDAKEYRAFLSDHGFVVPAFQAILFGCPELQVFEPASHKALLARLELVARLASWLGAKILVFGAPKNRKRNGREFTEAFQYAAGFFHQAGEIVKQYGCAIGMEANPVEYQCDFLTNTADAERFVKTVDSSGVVLHIDSGATVMTHEKTEAVLTGLTIMPQHYHISEPMLANAGEKSQVEHVKAFEALRRIGYAGAVSIEMKMQEPDFQYLEKALAYITGAMKDAGF